VVFPLKQYSGTLYRTEVVEQNRSMSELETIQRDLKEMQQRLLTAQHDSFMRDVELQRADAFLTKTMESLTRDAVRISEAVNHLLDQTRNLVQRMDQTDKRWNELITMLSKEHGNGGKQ
jgi:hypothetical protein